MHVVGRDKNRYGHMTCQVELSMMKPQLDALYSLIRIVTRAREVEHTWRTHPSQGIKGTEQLTRVDLEQVGRNRRRRLIDWNHHVERLGRLFNMIVPNQTAGLRDIKIFL